MLMVRSQLSAVSPHVFPFTGVSSSLVLVQTMLFFLLRNLNTCHSVQEGKIVDIVMVITQASWNISSFREKRSNQHTIKLEPPQAAKGPQQWCVSVCIASSKSFFFLSSECSALAWLVSSQLLSFYIARIL